MKINNPVEKYNDKMFWKNFHRLVKEMEKDNSTIPFPYPLPKPTKIKLNEK